MTPFTSSTGEFLKLLRKLLCNSDLGAISDCPWPTVRNMAQLVTEQCQRTTTTEPALKGTDWEKLTFTLRPKYSQTDKTCLFFSFSTGAIRLMYLWYISWIPFLDSFVSVIENSHINLSSVQSDSSARTLSTSQLLVCISIMKIVKTS